MIVVGELINSTRKKIRKNGIRNAVQVTESPTGKI